MITYKGNYIAIVETAIKTDTQEASGWDDCYKQIDNLEDHGFRIIKVNADEKGLWVMLQFKTDEYYLEQISETIEKIYQENTGDHRR